MQFRASRRLRFEDTKRIMSPEMCTESFGTLGKRDTGPSCSKGGQHYPMDNSKDFGRIYLLDTTI